MDELTEKKVSGWNNGQEIMKEIKSKVRNEGQRNYLYSYLVEINKFDALSRKEEVELAIAKDAGSDSAREKLINHNLKWVVAIARKIWIKHNYKFELQELIAQGNLGLITAVDRFKYAENSRLSTYATHWIILEIRKYISASQNIVANPEHMSNKMRTVANIHKNLEMILTRKPRPEEIREMTNQRLDIAEVEQIIKLLQNSTSYVSLDSPNNVSKDDGSEDISIGDCIADDTHTPAEKCLEKDRSRGIKEALDALKPLQKEILKGRYGLNQDGKILTFDELSDDLQKKGFLTREGKKHTKQYLQAQESKALEILRTNPKILEILGGK